MSVDLEALEKARVYRYIDGKELDALIAEVRELRAERDALSQEIDSEAAENNRLRCEADVLRNSNRSYELIVADCHDVLRSQKAERDALRARVAELERLEPCASCISAKNALIARMETAQVKFEAAIELDAQRQARIAELERLGNSMHDGGFAQREAWRRAVRG